MGADFLAAAIAFKRKKNESVLSAGKILKKKLAALAKLIETDKIDQKEWEDFADNCLNSYSKYDSRDNNKLTVDEIRADALEVVQKIEYSIGGRETCFITCANYSILVSGGMSWGDDPNEACTVIWKFYDFPGRLLKKVGLF